MLFVKQLLSKLKNIKLSAKKSEDAPRPKLKLPQINKDLLDPNKWALTRVGLAIGEKEVVAVQLRLSLKGLQIISSAQTEILSSMEGVDSDLTPVGYAVQQVMKHLNAKASDVLLALPGRDTFVRYFDMPKLPRKEWVGAARFEARKYIPFNVSELCHDLHITANKSGRLDVIFVGGKKEKVNASVDDVRIAGYSVAWAEPVFLSQLRVALSEKKLDAKITRMLFFIDGHGGVDTVITKRGMPLLARRGLVEGGDADSYVSEARLAFDYFLKSFKLERLEEVLVSCPDAISDVVNSIQDELKIKTRRFHPTQHLFKNIEAHQSLSGAIGVAIGGLSFPRKLPLNIGPTSKAKRAGSVFEIPDLPPQEEKKFLQKIIGRFAVILAVIFGLMWLGAGAEYGSAKKEFAANKVQLQKMDKKLARKSAEALKDIKEEEDLRKRRFEYLIENNVVLTDKLSIVASKMPKNAWMTDFNFSDKDSGRALELRMQMAETPIKEAVVIAGKFVEELNASEDFIDGFKRISVADMRQKETREGAEVVVFVIKGEVDPKMMEAPK